MAYCNSGPPIVARIIEKKTGREFESLVKQQMFAPLGMGGITFRRDGAALTQLVTNYSNDNQKEEPYWAILRRPAGSLNASALELMPFVQMLMQRGTYRGQQLLSPASVDRMELPTTTLSAKAGSKDGYGLHNYTTSHKGYLFHGHDGGVNGGLAHYVYNSGLNLGFIVLVNSDGGGFTKLNNAVMKAVMEPVVTRLPNPYDLPEAEKAATLGYYRASNPRNALFYPIEWLAGVARVYEDSSRLYMKNLLGGDTVPLYAVAKGRFMRVEKKGGTDAVTLVRHDDGTPGLVAGWTNTVKTTALGAWLPIVLAGLALLLTATAAVAGLVWLILYIVKKRRKQTVSALPLRLSLWGYALSFLTIVFTLATFGSGFDLGNVGGPSITIFVASLLVAFFAVASAWLWIRSVRQVSLRADRVFLATLVVAALLVAGYMAAWGLVGLRLWA